MPEPEQPAFDMDGFVERYQAGSEAAAKIHAAELGYAFSTLQIRMDAGFALVDRRFTGMDTRLDRIERILAKAFPDEYRETISENGRKP